MDVLFAKTRHHYDSYSDFWRLVELSGFESVYIDEMDMYDPNKAYITAPHNGEWNPHLDNHPDRRAQFFLWNLERPGEQTIQQYIAASNYLKAAGYFTNIISSDAAIATQARWVNVPLGSHYGLGAEPIHSSQKTYDLIHLMCYSLRRAFMFDYLTPRTVLNGISIAPNGWGEERHQALQRSRYMLNIHQDGHHIIEPIRFAIAAAYGLPIISEDCNDFWPYRVGGHLSLVEPTKESVIAVTERLCQSYAVHRPAALAMRDKMCNEFSFRRCIERFL